MPAPKDPGSRPVRPLGEHDQLPTNTRVPVEGERPRNASLTRLLTPLPGEDGITSTIRFRRSPSDH